MRERQQQGYEAGGTRRARTAGCTAFDGRQAGYNQFIDTLRQHFMADLDRQHGANSRQLKFGLARGGLTGGSFAGDAGQNLAREYQRGALTAEQRAPGGLADLQAADEQARLNLYQLVQGGTDATTAAQRAGTAMRNTLAGARSSNLAEGLGDIFGGTADLYRQQQLAAERRRGVKESDLYTSPFTRGDG